LLICANVLLMPAAAKVDGVLKLNSELSEDVAELLAVLLLLLSKLT